MAKISFSEEQIPELKGKMPVLRLESPVLAPETTLEEFALNATLPALQNLLYRLESGVPYIFVDTLSMQTGTSGERAMANPVLKVTLNLHAFWRRAKA